MSEPFGEKKSSGLAVTSLILGIFAFICLGILSGIPAIICGHIARGKIQREPLRYEGAGAALAGLILGYVSVATTLIVIPILAALALPAISGALQKAQATQHLSEGRQIQLAIEQMVNDGKAKSDKSLGYPADAGITTGSDLKSRLVKGGYLSDEDLAKLHFDEFEFGNVSENDPGNTITLRLQPKPPAHYLIIFEKNGDGSIFLKSQRVLGENPPRDPPYLAP